MAKKNKAEVYFSEKELKKILEVDDDFKKKIFITNEIFTDLVNCEEFKPKKSKVKNKNGEINSYEKGANANHIAFAFSYLYLASYMYRYARFTYSNDTGETFIDDQTMYRICGTSPTSRGKNGVNYITKKNGLLEKIGYIKKEKDYSINYFYVNSLGYKVQDFKYEKIKSVAFSMYSELELPTNYPKEPKARKINFPVKGFHYDTKSKDEEKFNGYFFYFDNTTEIDIRIFIYCMSRKELGTIGFYVYCFLKSKCDYFGSFYDSNSYTRSIDDLVKDTGIGKAKLIQVLRILEEHNTITNTHNPFVINLPNHKKLPANTYTVLDYNHFTKYGKIKVETRKVMSYEQYDAQVGIYLGNNTESTDDKTDTIHISEDELPF
ncbi:MAG TPA: hypothetical protein VNM45_19330 [Bacillus sp. (in: firmicutes)]|nr:hypothetical protein [Bacillus sp. (in: firmicutes)]